MAPPGVRTATPMIREAPVDDSVNVIDANPGFRVTSRSVPPTMDGRITFGLFVRTDHDVPIVPFVSDNACVDVPTGGKKASAVLATPAIATNGAVPTPPPPPPPPPPVPEYVGFTGIPFTEHPETLGVKAPFA